MKDYKKLYENLLKEFQQYKDQSIKWSIEDFTNLEIEGWQINDEQAEDALIDLIHHHDANYGICWIDVEEFLKQHGEEVEEGTELWRKKLEYN